MKITAKKSPLQLLGFQVDRFEFSTNKDEETNDNMDVFSNHNIEIDFDIFENGTSLFIMTFQCEIKNTQNVNLGYDISLSAAGMFSLDTANIKKDETANYKEVSPLNIMIGNVRGFLRTMTSYSYYGEYILPSIDIGELLKSKSEQIKA